MNKKVVPNAEQEEALELMLSGQNVFLTSPAGGGKSKVLKWFRERSDKNVVFLAPTGTAAQQINGRTIHSFFELPVMPEYGENYKPKISKERRELIKALDVLVVDEISMVRSDMFELINRVLQSVMQSSKPFGGKQIITCGDFFQLPPIVKGHLQRIGLIQYFGGIYAFSTEAWQESGLVMVYLEQIHRQENYEFIDCLNAIRLNSNKRYCFEPSDIFGLTVDHALKKINSMVSYKPSEESMCLCMTRRDAQRINEFEDSKLSGEKFHLEALIEGEVSDDLNPFEKILCIRNGSRVMLTRNKTDSAGGFIYTNGSLGKVFEFNRLTGELSVLLDSGKFVSVEPATEQIIDYELKDGKVWEKVIGSVTQYPLQLGYAVTVHKSQGLSLDNVHIVKGRGGFAQGQIYVALSRCRSIGALSISFPLERRDLGFMDHDILMFYANNLPVEKCAALQCIE